METLSTLIREATAIDAEAVSRVRVRSWQAAYRGIIDDAYLDALSIEAGRDRYLRTFDPDPAASFTRLVVDDDGHVTGFATAGAQRSRGAARRSAEVYLIYLLPGVQRQGLGTRLMRSMARGLDRRGMASLVVWALARNLGVTLSNILTLPMPTVCVPTSRVPRACAACMASNSGPYISCFKQ